MEWTVLFDEAFEPEFADLDEAVQDELLAHAKLLETFGPQLGRPRADTLNGSKHANMKELRFDATDGVWRVAFAFDPERHAILLVAGDKAGTSEKRFYKQLIKKADERFDEHLKRCLKPDGLLMALVIDNVRRGQFIPTYIRTLQEVFGRDHVHLVVFQGGDIDYIGSHTCIIVASQAKLDLDDFADYVAKRLALQKEAAKSSRSSFA